MKKETLEEAAENGSEYLADWEDKEMYQKGFKEGAEWQQEQDKKMYSEEDMHNLMDEYQNWLFNTNDVILTFREWFKQFKK